MDSRDSSGIILGENPDALAEIARKSTRGGFVLTAGNLASTVVVAIAVIVIARLLGPEGYGVYTLALTVPGLMLLPLGIGTNNAVTRYAAYYSGKNDRQRAVEYVATGTIFILLSGVVLTAASFAFAGALSAYLLLRPGITPLVELASVAVIGEALSLASVSAFVGWQMMGAAGFLPILQSVVKVVLALALVLTGFGVAGGIIAHIAGVVIAGSAGIVYLYFRMLRTRLSVARFYSNLKTMLAFGFPTFVGYLVSAGATQYVTIILAVTTTTLTIGVYQAAFNLMAPLKIVASSFALALFPTFAEIEGIGSRTGLAFRHAVRYTGFILVPLALTLVLDAKPGLDILYGPLYAGGVPYLGILSLANLSLGFGFSVLPIYFTGVGKTRYNMYFSIVSAVLVFFPVAFFTLLLGFGVYGVLYSSVLSNFVTTAVGLLYARRIGGATLDLATSAGTLVAGGIGLAAGLVSAPLVSGDWPSLLLRTAVFVFVYLSALPLFRAVKSVDVAILKSSSRSLGVFSKLLAPFLSYEELLIDMLRRIGVSPSSDGTVSVRPATR